MRRTLTLAIGDEDPLADVESRLFKTEIFQVRTVPLLYAVPTKALWMFSRKHILINQPGQVTITRVYIHMAYSPHSGLFVSFGFPNHFLQEEKYDDRALVASIVLDSVKPCEGRTP